jgi:CotS family spore coat protein
VADAAECEAAAKALARLHLSMRGILLPEDVMPCYSADDPNADFKRHTAELARARSFIRKKSHKDDFELAFLRAYDRCIGQAEAADSFLDTETMLALCEKQSAEKMYVHGDCTQHNIRIAPSGITFINFEKTGAHLQMKDVYLFMRKILEKNNWSFVLGQRLLDAYTSVNPLEKPELRYLCARFLYPEKFWKIANGYLNRRKSLPARRMQEKLVSFEEREQYRQEFLEQWMRTCR